MENDWAFPLLDDEDDEDEDDDDWTTQQSWLNTRLLFTADMEAVYKSIEFQSCQNVKGNSGWNTKARPLPSLLP